MEYTPQQLNYFRICYIAFNLVLEGLRKVFKQEWNFLYMTTPFGEWKDNPKNGSDFYNNETGKSRRKNALYLATIQKGNTAEWDCSCLLFAILFSDSIGTTLSSTIRKEVDDLRRGWTYWCWIPELCSKSDSCIYIIETLNWWNRGC